MEEILKNLGPLAPLVGVWEGNKGDDVAPDDDRQGSENNKFREQIRFEAFGPVDNHEQKLFGLRFSKMAWRLGEADSFHEETGYWLWDGAREEVYCCFIVPRGVTVLAGGAVKADDRKFRLEANLGSATYGIASNPFLDREFKTVKYEITVEIHDGRRISYDETTYLQMPGRPQPFAHTDRNTLQRV
ncbi:MAG: heme-binding beta-barrel domain-containing protein [Bacteriovoracia bacterium]